MMSIGLEDRDENIASAEDVAYSLRCVLLRFLFQ